MKLRGRTFELSRQEVERSLKGLKSELNNQASYYVLVGKKELPVKKALEIVLKNKGLDLSLLDFTTQDAVRIFKKLGFDVIRRGKGNILSLAGAIKGGGNAVEDEERLYESSS